MKKYDLLLFYVFVVFVSYGIVFSHASITTVIFTAQDWMVSNVPMPFVGRTLVADVVRAIADIFGFDYSAGKIKKFFLLIEFGALIASVVFIQNSLNNLAQKGNAIFIATIFLFWQVAYMFFVSPIHRYWYAYDVVSILTMSAGLYFIISNKFFWLAVVVVLGTWNRETAVLLAAWYFLYNFTNSNVVQLTNKTLFLILLWFATKTLVLYSHGLTGGSFTLYDDTGSLRIIKNIDFYSNSYLFASLGSFGFLWLFLLNKKRFINEINLYRCFYVFIPYLGAMFFVGNINEIRIFTEFVPLVSLLLANIIDLRIRAKDSGAE